MKYNDNGEYKDIYIKTFDTLPVGAEVDFDGETVPDGWSEIEDPNTYSNTEVRIGTWFDGKPLYRKVLTVPTLPNNNEITITIDSTFIIKKFDVYVKNPAQNNNITFRLPVVGTNYINAFIYNDKITIQTTSDRTAFTDNYVIIEYTKTTD